MKFLKKYFILILNLIVLSININLFAQDDLGSPNEAPEEDLEAPIGIDIIKKIDFSFSPKVLIGDSQKLQLIVIPSKKEITFRGLKPGATSVIIRDNLGNVKKKFKVNVTATGNSTVVSELRDLIGDVEGIEIGIKGGKVYVGGEIIVPDDIGKLAAVLSSDDYKNVLRLIELSPHTQTVIARKIQDELSKNNMREVSVRVVNKTFWLEGVVNSASKKTLAVEIAKAFLPDKISSLSSASGRVEASARALLLDFIAVNEEQQSQPPPKMVKVSSQFVELSKDYSKIFGFKWAPFMSQKSSISFNKTNEGGVTTSEEGTLAGTISNLFPKLSSARNAGYARIIQSGMIITETGKEGKINKTKKVPYASGTGEFSKAQEATIKFDLATTPNILEGEKVAMKVVIAVELPSGTTADGNPITTSNNINTSVAVNSKESAVIGGIVQNSSSTGYDKNDPDPVQAANDSGSGGQREVPLFTLLKSKGYITSQSQFVVFVTPEIIESASEGTEEIRKKFRKRVR